MTDVKRIEDSVRAGRNALLTTVFQTVEVHYASMLTGEALEVAGLPAVPFGVRMVSYLAPSVLAFFIKHGIGSPCLRKCALFIQDNIGLVCQIAAVVSAIALIALGHLAMGIAATAFITIGFLDKLGLLPEPLRQILHTYGPMVRVVTGLIIGDLFEKFFAIVSLVSYCYEKYTNSTEAGTIDELSEQKEALDFLLLNIILNEPVELEINPYHLKLDTLAPPPNVSIQELIPLFDSIDWLEQLPILKAKFASDARFEEFHGKIESINEQAIIILAKEWLQTFLDEIINRHIINGEIHDYDRLENYLKTVTDQLQKTENTQTKADALMRLAIEGGGYCGPGKFHVVEELYSELALQSNTIPTDIKILLRLQDARTHWFQTKYAETNLKKDDCCLTKCMKWIFDFQDLHLYNIFLNLHGQSLALRKASADNDYASGVDPITKLGVKKFTEHIQESFKALYTTDYAISQLQDGVGHASLPRSDLFQWWNKWIERQPIDDAEKQALSEELENNNTLLGKPMQEGNVLTPGPFNVNFLKAMALDLGILKRKFS